MKYLRLLYVSLLLSIVVTGCNRRRVQELPAPAPPPPIVSTMPPMPPLTSPTAVVEKPAPAAPVIPVETSPPIKKKTHRRRKPAHKSQATPSTPANSNPEGTVPPGGTPAPESGASPIGQLSGEDTNISPKQIEQTRQLIRYTEKRARKLSSAQQQAHKDALAQVSSFLNQAKQALSANDLTGAKTLANKANILMDELLK